MSHTEGSTATIRGLNLQTRRTVFKLTATYAVFAIGIFGQAFAQNTPAKSPGRPVKVIVALAAGGSVDMIARTVGKKLSAPMRQPFVVDNRAGASGQIGRLTVF